MTVTDDISTNFATQYSIAEVQNALDFHNQIADYLSSASNLNNLATVFHQNGNHEKASHYHLKAFGKMMMAVNLQKENFLNQALISVCK